MSTREVVDCDLCPAKDIGAHPHTVSGKVDRVTDAAGSREDVYDALDLCPGCLHRIVQSQLRNLGCDSAKTWFEETRRLKVAKAVAR